MKRFIYCVALAFVLTTSLDAASVGPLPYLSFSDSPWSNNLAYTMVVEDFENGVLNNPSVTVSGATTIAAPGPLTDSVDADDFFIDGSGTSGRSHYTTDGATGIAYTFSPFFFGGPPRLPTHAGVVWTDLSGTADVFLEAFDENSASLGILAAGALNDGVSTGETAEDRFLGWENPSGISSIRVYQSGSDMEVDHLQYGVAVPEPTTVGLALAAMGLCRWRRR